MLTVKGSDLASALAMVGRVVDKPSDGSAYQCVFCVPAHHALYMHTTNGGIWCSYNLVASGEMEPFLVHWESFRRFAAASKNKELTITKTDKSILVKGEGCRAVLARVDIRNFPAWPQNPMDAWIKMDGECVSGMVDRVIKHNGKATVFPAMTGFQLEIRDGCLGLTATDGKRLARVEKKGESWHGSGEVVVPEASLDLLSRAKRATTIAINRHWLSASWDQFSMASRLIDGKYPDWRRITEIELPRSASVPLDGLLAAMKQLLDVGDYCGLRITPGEPGSMFLWTAGKTAQVSVRVPCHTTEKVDLFLVPGQVIDFLARMEGETVVLSWNVAEGPIRLAEEGRDHDIYISMGCKPIPAPTEGIADA